MVLRVKRARFVAEGKVHAATAYMTDVEVVLARHNDLKSLVWPLEDAADLVAEAKESICEFDGMLLEALAEDTAKESLADLQGAREVAKGCFEKCLAMCDRF